MGAQVSSSGEPHCWIGYGNSGTPRGTPELTQLPARGASTVRTLRTTLGFNLETPPTPRPEGSRRGTVLRCGLRREEIIDLMHRDLRPDDYEVLSRLDEQLPKRSTLPKKSLESLSFLKSTASTPSTCGVCLADVDCLAECVQLPCVHKFHHECISRWLTECKNACPLCSTPFEPL